MITTNKNKRNLTIDLKGIMAQEYLDSKKSDFTILKEKFMKIMSISRIALLVTACFFGWGMIAPIDVKAYDTSENIGVRDKIRQERIEICQKAYKESEINEQFIYDQVPVVRCATYMSLIYAFESSFGKSRKCVEQKNCHGMKGNGVNHPAGFITFNSHTESREWFANRYFKFHYKKDIKTFVYNWSMTDQKVYTEFIKARFWEMYRELEYQYMNGNR